MKPMRVGIQRRELEASLTDAGDTVIRRAAEALAYLLDGGTVIVEEFIVAVGDEEIIEETILEAVTPQ